MGKFSCKQIELQALVAPRGKNDFGTLFFWVQNIGPKNFCPNLGGVFGSNVPLALLIDP